MMTSIQAVKPTRNEFVREKRFPKLPNVGSKLHLEKNFAEFVKRLLPTTAMPSIFPPRSMSDTRSTRVAKSAILRLWTEQTANRELSFQ
ncbi:hypothetical protein Poly41_52590 [Novipirellula artificiosorum]|uniref:Uncharacterized protein n=1 Tax=Novipirellula artificiosorum TaxID=2528016 RepID=A0A5C6DAX8_9BACT|nr:hypothetical protein Poly41_52590 [Novipirellula artificiosorum]